jgi:hypothetical protein
LKILKIKSILYIINNKKTNSFLAANQQTLGFYPVKLILKPLKPVIFSIKIYDIQNDFPTFN